MTCSETEITFTHKTSLIKSISSSNWNGRNSDFFDNNNKKKEEILLPDKVVGSFLHSAHFVKNCF